MENIFKDAYFGKMYVTRDGRKAIYFRQDENKWHELIVEGERISLPYQDNGLAFGNHLETPEWGEDIVSELEEEIDEEHLDDLADGYASAIAESEHHGEYVDVKDIFKAGYYKAKGE